MARKAAKAAREAPATESETPKSVSKAEAVRDAIAKGMESPGEIVDFLRSQYGIGMTKQMASSYKAQQKARDRKNAGRVPNGKAGRKPKARVVEGYLAPPPKQRGSGETDLLDAMEAMKPLIASLGVEKVKRIAELLG